MKRLTPLLSLKSSNARLAPSRATGNAPAASRFIVAFICAVVLAYTVSLRAEEAKPHELVAQANSALADGDAVKALHLYDEAEKLLPDSAEIAYDQGVAQYRKGDYDKATELFTKALATRDLTLDAKARFNLGNCAYASALKEKENLQAAIDKLQEAIVRYREALEADPDDLDARANIERAQLLIKDLIDKEKQKQEQEKKKQEDEKKQDQSTKPSEDQQPSSQPESQPSPQDQDKKDQQKQDQQQKDQQQKQDQQQQQKQGDQQDEQNKQESQDGQKKEGKPEAAEPQKGGENKDQQQQQEQPQPVPATQQAMTPEEAQRMLQIIRDKEQKRRDDQAKQIRVIRVPVDKDW